MTGIRVRASMCGAAVVLAVFVGGGAASAQSIERDLEKASAGPDVCRTGVAAPACLARPFVTTFDVASPADGPARPAVAKDVISGHPNIHAPAFLNDGFYGNGASWVAGSAGSWVKIDLGRENYVTGIRFGRDRTGNFEDRPTGQFKVLVAASDDVYANGNDANDDSEYKLVVDSQALGFSGTIPKKQTVLALLPGGTTARFVKVWFAAAGAAIDEIEMSGSPCAAGWLLDDGVTCAIATEINPEGVTDGMTIALLVIRALQESNWNKWITVMNYLGISAESPAVLDRKLSLRDLFIVERSEGKNGPVRFRSRVDGKFLAMNAFGLGLFPMERGAANDLFLTWKPGWVFALAQTGLHDSLRIPRFFPQAKNEFDLQVRWTALAPPVEQPYLGFYAIKFAAALPRP